MNFELREERVRARPASRRVFLYNVQARRGVSFNLIETRCTVLLVVLVRLGILHESYMMYELVLYTGMYACINMYASYEDVRGVSRFFGLQNLKNQRYLQRLVELEQDEVEVAVPPPRSRLDGEYACIHPCQ